MADFDIDDLYRELFGYVGAPVPFLTKDFESYAQSRFNTPAKILSAINSLKNGANGYQEIMHVSLTADEINGGEPWKFPIQPIVSLISGTQMKRRFTSASGTLRGSIKERWSEDDDIIRLQGVLMDPAVKTEDKSQGFNPSVQFQLERLYEFKRLPKAIRIENRLLAIVGITHIAIEKIELSPYPSTRVRPFTIKAYSDDNSHSLLE